MKSKYEDIWFWKFTCPVCNNTLQQGKPFELRYCPYCAVDIKVYNKRCGNIRHSSDVEKRNLLEGLKSKFSLTAEEKDAIDYATMLIQNEIDGEVD